MCILYLNVQQEILSEGGGCSVYIRYLVYSALARLKLDVASAYISENCAAGGHGLYLHDPDSYDERDTNEVYNVNIRELILVNYY